MPANHWWMRGKERKSEMTYYDIKKRNEKKRLIQHQRQVRKYMLMYDMLKKMLYLKANGNDAFCASVRVVIKSYGEIPLEVRDVAYKEGFELNASKGKITMFFKEHY